MSGRRRPASRALPALSPRGQAPLLVPAQMRARLEAASPRLPAQRLRRLWLPLAALRAASSDSGPPQHKDGVGELEADGRLNFGPAWAGDALVSGARRPGWSRPRTLVDGEAVSRWMASMKQERGVRRVLCLLSVEHLQLYEAGGHSACLESGTCEPTLIERYRRFFGAERVHWLSTSDFDVLEAAQLRSALSTLDAAVGAAERILVHCSGGSGRTGQVLAGWRVHHHGLNATAALSRPFDPPAKRVPMEGLGRMSGSLDKQIEQQDYVAAIEEAVVGLSRGELR
jgi:hypothetical protein